MILIRHENLPLAFNPAQIEIVICDKELSIIMTLNKRITKTEIKYTRIKLILPEYFVEIKSPSVENHEKTNFVAMVNTRLISELGWNKSFNKNSYNRKEPLIYNFNVPKNERWCEDKETSHLDYVGLVMFSGAYIPVSSDLMSMLSIVEKKKIKDLENNILCPDTLCT
jgi:hypothetical protein